MLLILIYVLYVFNYIPHRKYSNEDFNIDTYISQVDKDLDGVDDQTDILEGVRNYIAKKPKYKSKYYATGYPDDLYGVCTDVVANALNNTNEDIVVTSVNEVFKTEHEIQHAVQFEEINKSEKDPEKISTGGVEWRESICRGGKRK